jgi:isocitrate dehydrogenase
MRRITIAKGDGIGPEIMDACLQILKAAGVELAYDEVQIGEAVYLSANTSGISKEAWDMIRKNKVFLKAPITTPQGGGYKSLNVTARKSLGLYANVRPCRSFYPYVRSKHPKLDIVVIRENEEDLYAGIEHQQTAEVVQCLKLISRPGCEKIIRYAFEYAQKNNRKKVTCLSKDNIMKQTDGLFHQVFNEISKEYLDIENEHMIVDIGMARVADSPENFDVIVTSNLNGDIVSDVVAQIAGSVGMAGSFNLGEHAVMFEAIHGSAPDIARKNIANPSALIQSAVLMLVHLGQAKTAEKIQNAWLKTIEEGIHTTDIYKSDLSSEKVGTKEFAEAVIKRLGQKPQQLKAASFSNHKAIKLRKYDRSSVKPMKKSLKGVDLFVDKSGILPDDLARNLQQITEDFAELNMITNRGVKVWPDGFEETFCTDHWRCRFLPKAKEDMTKDELILLLQNALSKNIDVIKTENLYTFDGATAYSLGQGQ